MLKSAPHAIYKLVEQRRARERQRELEINKLNHIVFVFLIISSIDRYVAIVSYIILLKQFFLLFVF